VVRVSIENINFCEKKVVIRLDLNVPLRDGQVQDTTRIERIIPTLKKILNTKPKYIVILSHLGRPKAKPYPQWNETDSLEPVAGALQDLLGQPVIFSRQPIGAELYQQLNDLPNGSIAMAENIRFYSGEVTNSEEFSKQLSLLGDVFVNDAFSCSHRVHASVVGITKYLPSYTGLCLNKELSVLENALGNPDRPVIGIIAGSKVSTKIDLLLNLLNKLDYMFVGGGMANTLLYAQGYKMGGSLVENDRLGVAEAILQKAKTSKCELLLPIDAAVAQKLEPNISTQIVGIDMINADQAMYDIGPKTLERLKNIIRSCKTVLWNGPVGVYEVPPFAQGSISIAKFLAEYTQMGKITSIAGGGDTIAVIGQDSADFTYVSTAGGAFLEWLEGKSLPGIEALESAQMENTSPQEKGAA
jgi:phosphoglycerate kinase